jgi:hypothetical protein
VVVAGGPRAGKSYLSEAFTGTHRVRGTDEISGLDWSASSLAASFWLNEPGPWFCEGVMMPRALRKWLARAEPHISPADLVIWLGEPVVERSRGQHVMALGCHTVWNEIRPDLIRRGTRIIEL